MEKKKKCSKGIGKGLKKIKMQVTIKKSYNKGFWVEIFCIILEGQVYFFVCFKRLLFKPQKFCLNQNFFLNLMVI